jgi:homoserine acetyltransferase
MGHSPQRIAEDGAQSPTRLLNGRTIQREVKTGLAAARTVALLSYRSYEGYCRTQSEDDPECFLARKACTYHQYQGRKLTDRFNAYSYYYLTLSLDTHNVGRTETEWKTHYPG